MEIKKKGVSTKIHFGFEDVEVGDKQKKVTDVFNSVARKYDIMNDIMSFGLHRIWKKETINKAVIIPGQKVLDLAGGTADLTCKLARKVGEEGEIFLSDINRKMLEIGKEKLLDRGHIKNIRYIQANAENLPFKDNFFDCVTISFGLRNLTNKQNGLSSIYRVLKPGGKLLILEFSTPSSLVLTYFYDMYSLKILPLMGKWIVNDSRSYQYLSESIRKQPNQEKLIQMMQDVGFEKTSYKNMTGGVVALHVGYKY